MTPTQRKAMQDALEALENERPYLGPAPNKVVSAIAALTAALAEPAPESEPIGEVVACNDYGHPWKRVSGYEWALSELPVGAMVYAAPVREPAPPSKHLRKR